jgi:hypothetical protein
VICGNKINDRLITLIDFVYCFSVDTLLFIRPPRSPACRQKKKRLETMMLRMWILFTSFLFLVGGNDGGSETGETQKSKHIFVFV